MPSYPDYYWLNKDSRTFLERGYLRDGITPEKRIREISDTAGKLLNIPGFADKFEGYMKKGYISLSSPIWSNFGAGRGLPISCNGSYIEDTVASILGKTAEVGMMSKMGAGTSAYLGDLRSSGSAISTGGKTSGPVHFLGLFDSVVNIISQSNVRRGSFAAYLPVEHADIEDFLSIRNTGHKIQDISIGVCISDEWMQRMIDGDKSARRIWLKIIRKRFESGYPYIFFSDTVNNTAPKVYKERGLKIHASNLCSEIALSSSSSESFVCDLSSINLLHWDELKNTDVIETLTYFLDAVMTEYIEKVKDIPFMSAAYNFAVNQRAIGIGVLGWHSYLQANMVPFDSFQAKLLNTTIFKTIQERTDNATKEMAIKYGEPPLLRGYSERNVTRLAIAPTTSSSFILGQVSPSIEPFNSCFYVRDLAKGRFTYKNPFLEEVLEKHGKNNSAVWKSIMVKGGSVQHLEFLSDNERAVFKSFGEISQKEIIIQAVARQKYIDQSQSLNLMIPADISTKQVSDLMIFAWENKCKTLYYQRGTNPAQALVRNILTCSSCEG